MLIGRRAPAKARPSPISLPNARPKANACFSWPRRLPHWMLFTAGSRKLARRVLPSNFTEQPRKRVCWAQLQQSWESRRGCGLTGRRPLNNSGVREQLSTYVERLHHRHRNGLTVYTGPLALVGANIRTFASHGPRREHDEAALQRRCAKSRADCASQRRGGQGQNPLDRATERPYT